MSWREEPITEKQKAMMASMRENAAMNGAMLSYFDGKTKGEASDWISKNIGEQYRSLYCEHENAGDRDD